MKVFIACVVVFAISLLGMAVGVIFSDRRIKGSCGGLSGVDGAGSCDSCSAPEDCDSFPQQPPAESNS